MMGFTQKKGKVKMDTYSTQYRDEQEAAAKDAEKAAAKAAELERRRKIGEKEYSSIGARIRRFDDAVQKSWNKKAEGYVESLRPVHHAIGRGIGKISKRAGEAYTDFMDTGIDINKEYCQGKSHLNGTLRAVETDGENFASLQSKGRSVRASA